MDAITTQVMALAVVQLLAFPLLAFVCKRIIAKRMDMYDEKREQARVERDEYQKESSAWRDAMTAGMRSLLRAEIIGEHRRAVRDEECPIETKEYLTRLHAAYKGVGGNDIGDALYEEVMKLPTTKREDSNNE